MIQNRSEQTQNHSGKRKKILPLQTRLVLFVLSVALVPLLILATRDTLQTQQALTNAAEISLKSGAAQTVNSLDSFIQTTLDSIGVEAQFIDFTTYLTVSPSEPILQARALDLLNKLRNKDDLYIISYALVDINGNVLLDTVNFNIGNNESGETYFPQVNLTSRPIVSAVTYSDDKTTSLTFASKIVNINGDYIGVLRVKYDSAVLQDVIISSVGSSTDVSVVLMDQFHIRMADSRNPELILKSIVPLEGADYSLAVNTRRFLAIPREEQATNYPDFELALDNAAGQPFFRAEITPEAEGDDTIAVSFMKTQPWIVAYSRPTSTFLAEVQEQIRANIILVLITLIILSTITPLIARSLTKPITALAKVADSISQGDLNARSTIKTTDEIGLLASAFNSMADQLQSTLVGLEQRVADRTKALAISTDVSRRLSTILDEKELTFEVVEQVRNAFDYYHVHIYLIDEKSQDLVMSGGTGEAGKNMMARGHRLARGKGLVGRAAETNTPVLVSDVSNDKDWLPNPLLPETKSEIAMPISIGSKVFGVLDVQHNITDGLDQEDVNVLRAISSQIAIALQNARSYASTQQRADRESLISSINQKILSETTVESAMQVAVREVGRALRTQARVQLNTTTNQDTTAKESAS
jgi:putative methionine-R-sulfoxide reductase with GAF domain